jgi:hypothetical protein
MKSKTKIEGSRIASESEDRKIDCFLLVQHFQKRKRISRGSAFSVVVEIDMHGAVLF